MLKNNPPASKSSKLLDEEWYPRFQPSDTNLSSWAGVQEVFQV